MERVGVRELRQNLSVWLRRVREGESFEVTERGDPVAVLMPYETLHPAIQRLAARGLLARPGRPGPLPPAQGQVDPEGTASRMLHESREDAG